MRYPSARRLDIVEDLHGHLIPDPYRWLEEADSSETLEWLDAQDELANSCLSGLSSRPVLRQRLRGLIPGVVSPPIVIGDRTFFTRRLPDQEHAVFVVREPDGEERALIDPSALSADLTTTLDGAFLSKEGDLLAYQLSEGGNEDPLMWVMDTRTGENVDGPIDRTKYGSVAWLPGGEEMFYIRRLSPDDVPEGEDLFHRRVWRHRIGSDPTEDQLVFGEGYDKTAYFGVSSSPDGRWLVVSAALGTAPRNDLFIADMFGDGTLRAIQEGVDASTHGVVAGDGRLYLMTNLDAPRNRLVVVDPAQPDESHWTDLLPQTDDVLADFTVTDTAVVAVRTHDIVSEITVHDRLTGEVVSKVDLPGLGSAGVSSRREGGDDVWIGYTDHVTPYKVLHLSVATGEVSTWADAPGAPDTSGIRARQVFYLSKDGTRIPMFVISRGGEIPSESTPTILYGYGGFNVAMSPGFSSSIAAWVEAGGVYAIANLRGGSEYGEEWHRAGMRDKKQNVFDDFTAGGEWLIDNGYTSKEQLGISGGSNGGLLVGAALTQRPDLFAAVVCSAPLLDMVRYESFLIGRTWNDEYGSADDAEELSWLVSYSPYHRVVEGAEYPAVLFTSFDSDTRTDPCHARKMCAALQWGTRGDRPIVFRREAKVGHSARSIGRTVDLQADTLAFLAERLGLEV